MQYVTSDDTLLGLQQLVLMNQATRLVMASRYELLTYYILENEVIRTYHMDAVHAIQKLKRIP